MLNLVKENRIKKGLSQEELAKLARVGRVTISNIETERYVPRVDIALMIAKALDTTVEKLFIISERGAK